jgi:hypothetical protein
MDIHDTELANNAMNNAYHAGVSDGRTALLKQIVGMVEKYQDSKLNDTKEVNYAYHACCGQILQELDTLNKEK